MILRGATIQHERDGRYGLLFPQTLSSKRTEVPAPEEPRCSHVGVSYGGVRTWQTALVWFIHEGVAYVRDVLRTRGGSGDTGAGQRPS